MDINSRTIAKRIVQILDSKDEKKDNKKIEKDAWNIFVKNIDEKQVGREITNYIKRADAEKSIATYLYRESKKQNISINDLGQKWLDNIEKLSFENFDDKTSDNNDKKCNVKGIDNSYSKMTKDKAEIRAEKDSRLERLSRGKGWHIVENYFQTDIPFARKSTGKILSFVSSLTGEHLLITSALGTAGNANQKSPHTLGKNNKYATHHNAENPKLDILFNNVNNESEAIQFQQKIEATGLFSFVSRENYHLDVQIDPRVYIALEKGHDLNVIQTAMKNNTINELIA